MQKQRESLLTQQSQVFMTAPIVSDQRRSVKPLQDLSPQLPPLPPGASSAPQKKPRFNSLDILRGLTVIGMLLVDDLSEDGPIWLQHPEWNGFTFADLIFPSFLFIMGMAVPLSLSATKPFTYRNLIRIIGLFAIGLFLNLFECKFNFGQFRVMGILQRISLCYGILCLVHVVTRYGQRSLRYVGLLITAIFITVYLTFMLRFEDSETNCTHQNNLSPFCNFGSYVDRKLFTRAHIYEQGDNDPQGLFTTLTAFVNSFAGYWFCLVMFQYKGDIKKILKTWIIASIFLGLAGLPLVWLMPLNKKIWSISYTFITMAVSGISLSLITIIFDVINKQNQTYQKIISIIAAPFIWFGRNPLAIFVSRDFLDDLLNTYIVIDGTTAWQHMYHYLFETWISNSEIVAVMFTLFMLLIFTLEAFLLFKFEIFIKL